MIKAKQIQGLENLESLALISASQATDGTVTLTRGDGATLSFVTGAGLDGSTGDKGPKGDTGPDGLGAYEIAIANGYSGTEAQWRTSLKGDTGNPGVPGANGAKGPAGITPTFQTTVSVSSAGVGANPTITRNTVTDTSTVKTYSLTMKIPQGKPGTNTGNGTSYTISTTGNITKSSTKAASAAAANLSWSGTVGTVNITVPTGNTGDTGASTTGSAGSTPTLSSVSKGADLSAGSTSWTCERGGTPDGGPTTYTIRLGQAAQGNKGPTGERGEPGKTSGSYISSKYFTTETVYISSSSSSIPDNRCAITLLYENGQWLDMWTWKKRSWHNFLLNVCMTVGNRFLGSTIEYGGSFYLFNSTWYELNSNDVITQSTIYDFCTNNPHETNNL